MVSKKRKERKQSEAMGIPPIVKFKPTKAQKQVGNLIKQNTLNFITGPAGTGKSTAVLYEYCQRYIQDKSVEITVIRTPVEAGSDLIGYLPSDYMAKIEPHFASARNILNEFLGKGTVDCDIGNRIHFVVPNYALGMTINGLILIDEAQQMTPLIMKLLLERIGNAKCCVVGDQNQLYTKDTRRNGLNDAVGRFFDEGCEPKFDDVGLYQFDAEDVQRSDIVKTVIRAYEGIIG